VLNQTYLARHAAHLLKLARSTSDRLLAAALIEKAIELRSRMDESGFRDLTPAPPDVEPASGQLRLLLLSELRPATYATKRSGSVRPTRSGLGQEDWSAGAALPASNALDVILRLTSTGDRPVHPGPVRQ
jgi:hypothetical protein